MAAASTVFLNGLENATNAFEDFDSGGGCGIKGYGHQTGLGGAHISTRSPSGANSSNASLNCRAELGICSGRGVVPRAW